MHGGIEAALDRNRAFFDRHGIDRPRGSGVAVDLGSGPGFQAIPLAERGYRVVAIDTDRLLLDELAAHKGKLDVLDAHDDLLRFRRHVEEPVELIVCMTDTLLHLASRDDVRHLFEDCAAALEPGGQLILTWRDMTRELADLDRFLPVRSDADTIFTCFLEYEPDTVKVHDLVYVRNGDAWEFRRSFYRKLRIGVEWVEAELERAGLADPASTTSRGMTTTVARRAA